VVRKAYCRCGLGMYEYWPWPIQKVTVLFFLNGSSVFFSCLVVLWVTEQAKPGKGGNASSCY
jgi:hypothetical protein